MTGKVNRALSEHIRQYPRTSVTQVEELKDEASFIEDTSENRYPYYNHLIRMAAILIETPHLPQKHSHSLS